MALVFMHNNTLIILTLWLFAASTIQGSLSLNPLSWFSSEEEKVAQLEIANAAEEAEAAAMLEEGINKIEAGRASSANRVFKKIITRYPQCTSIGSGRLLKQPDPYEQRVLGQSLRSVARDHYFPPEIRKL